MHQRACRKAKQARAIALTGNVSKTNPNTQSTITTQTIRRSHADTEIDQTVGAHDSTPVQ